MKPIIQVENLNFAYKKGEPILEDVNFLVNNGEILGITGSSGSGKTTLLYILKGIIPHLIKGKLKGNIIIHQMDIKTTKISKLAHSVGMVFQDLNTQLFSNTVREEVEFGLRNLKMDPALANNAMEELHISDLANKAPLNLSMGQKQRVILASIIAMQPKILLLDEPSVHLDSKNRIDLKNWLLELNENKSMTILIASNDSWLIGNMCNEVFHIEGRKVTRKSRSELIEKQSEWVWKNL
ncbi:MAG: ABC transporter ATP-binding protein [Candidatus Lokiarchaeota archaeon]|nr:ABC transporter ATP-binding protein [Candidatus Lokiarchaeota archaeon]